MNHNPHHHQHMPPVIPTPFGSCPPPPQPGNVQFVPVPVYPTPGGSCQPPLSVFPDPHHQHHDQHHQHFDPHHHHPDPHHHGHH